MAGKTSKASTQPPGEALSPKHEAFVQAYVTNGMNAVKAYQAAYPRSSEKAARSNATRLMENDGIQARIAEIMAVGAERAEVTAEEVIRELKKLGFSCIGKAVTWRNEVVTQELEGGEEGETRTVMVPRVTIVPTEDLDKATLDAIAEVSQQANGALRVKMHDKHAALVSLGRHLGLFRDHVKVAAVYGISEEPMSAEEWKFAPIYFSGPREFVADAGSRCLARARWMSRSR
jgi:phage terminase small subunit